MFKQRLLTTLILVPLVLLIIYRSPSWMLTGILLCLLGACAFEWSKMIPLKDYLTISVYVIVSLILAWLMSHWLLVGLGAGLLFWLMVLIAEMTYPTSQSYWGHPAIVGLAGWIFLAMFFSAFMGIYQTQQGQDLIVYVLVLVWAADIGAYLVGKRWGRRKLIPKVSPGKTVEGLCGALLLSLGVTGIGNYIFQPESRLFWFLLALSTVFISIVGDLLISMLKRRCHLKDSGNILPGHGGILDRLDSSIAAFPLFFCGLSFLEFTH